MSWTKIIKGLLNISEQPEKKDDEVVKGMPKLIQDLYADMREAEESVTLSMANVGQKRLRLKSILGILDQKKAETNATAKMMQSVSATVFGSTDDLANMSSKFLNGMGMPMQLEGFMKALNANPLAAGAVSSVAGKVGDVVEKLVAPKTEAKAPKTEK